MADQPPAAAQAGGSGDAALAMTAAALDADRQECLTAGMNAHVAKPIAAERLVETLLEWVSVAGIARERPAT